MGAKDTSKPDVRRNGGQGFILTIRCNARVHEKAQELLSVSVLGGLAGRSSVVRC